MSWSGPLVAIGAATSRRPLPPNLLGDYADGAMLLAMGLLAAMLHARRTRVDQVVDAVMIDGVNSLMTRCSDCTLRVSTMAPAAPTCWTRGRPATR